MNALRRQLSVTGWQAVGFFGALTIFAIFAVFWGRGIEGDLDKVIVKRQQDHRVIRQLVDEARPAELQANSRSVRDVENGSGGEVATGPAGGGGLAPVEPEGDDSQPPSKGGGKNGNESPTTQPEPGGPAPAPTSNATTTSSPPAAVEPEASPQTNSQGSLPATLEGAGEVFGQVIDKAEDTVQQTTCVVRDLLKPCSP